MYCFFLKAEEILYGPQQVLVQECRPVHRCGAAQQGVCVCIFLNLKISFWSNYNVYFRLLFNNSEQRNNMCRGLPAQATTNFHGFWNAIGSFALANFTDYLQVIASKTRSLLAHYCGLEVVPTTEGDSQVRKLSYIVFSS